MQEKKLNGVELGQTIGWNDIVKESFDKEELMDNFRMMKETFYILCEDVRPYLQSLDAPVRKPMDMNDKSPRYYWKC